MMPRTCRNCGEPVGCMGPCPCVVEPPPMTAPARRWEEEARKFFGCIENTAWKGPMHSAPCEERLRALGVRACEHLAALLSGAVEGERDACCATVIDACGACGGRGWVEGTGTESDEEGNAYPVPIQLQCEYCGRIAAAIRARKGEK